MEEKGKECREEKRNKCEIIASMLMYVCIRMVSVSMHSSVLSELCVVCCVCVYCVLSVVCCVLYVCVSVCVVTFQGVSSYWSRNRANCPLEISKSTIHQQSY